MVDTHPIAIYSSGCALGIGVIIISHNSHRCWGMKVGWGMNRSQPIIELLRLNSVC